MTPYLGILPGLAFALAAAAAYRSVRRWRRDTVAAAAIVVDKQSRLFSSLQSWNAVFEFTTRDGETVRVRSNTTTLNDPDVGDRVPIRYRPSNPADARIDRVAHLYALPVLLAFVACSAMAVWAATFFSLGPQLGGADPAPVAALGARPGGELPSAVAPLPRASGATTSPVTYASGRTLSFPGRTLRALALHPDGSVAAVALSGDTVVLVDLADGARLGVATPGGRVHSLAFSRDGARVFAGTAGRIVPVDVPSGRVTGAVDFGSATGGRTAVTDLAVSPSGEVAVATAGADVVFVDLGRARALGSLRAGDLPLARLAWSADGRRLASLSGRQVAVWPTADLAALPGSGPRCRLDLPRRGTAMTFARTGPHLVIALAPEPGEEGSLLVVDPESCRSRAVRTEAAGIMTSLAADLTGHRIFVPSRNGSVHVVPLTGGTNAARIEVEHGVAGVLASVDGRRIVAFSFAEPRLTVFEHR